MKDIENKRDCVIFYSMPSKLMWIITIFLSLLVPINLFAILETGGVENVFSFGAGLRAIGMGGAFTAMKNDPTLAYWNPGSMPFNQFKEVSLFGARTIANTFYFSGFYTHPTINFGTLSLGALGIYTKGIESYDENASPILSARTDYFHYQVLLSYGYNFLSGFGLGGTAKVEQMRITDYKGTGASFDVGTFYSPPKFPWLSMGLVVQDVFGTGIKIASEYEENTRIYKLGVATNFPLGEKKTNRLSFAIDYRLFSDNYNPGSKKLLYDISFGNEISFSDQVMLRMGYKNFTFDNLFQNLPAGISLGFTIRQFGVGLDYAVSFEDSLWQGPLELLMRLGLSYKFGKSIDEKKVLEAERIRKKIDDGIREATKEYEENLNKLARDYEREKERIILEMDENYQKRIAEIDVQMEDSRQEIIADLTSQFEAEKRRSLQELAQDYDRQRAQLETQLSQERGNYNRRVETLQRQFEEEKVKIKDQVKADESFKSDRYSKGLQYFADGNFKDAIAEFEAVARFDQSYLQVQEYIKKTMAEMADVSTYSQEILNIYYNGIDLFVQKKYEEAIKEWEKILKIDPYNKLATRNIKEAQERLKKLKELGVTR